MTPLRGLKVFFFLLFGGNREVFYFPLPGLYFVCNLSTGLHPVLINHTPSGLERLLPFVVLWQRNRFLFRPFRAGFWFLIFPQGFTLCYFFTPLRGWKGFCHLFFFVKGIDFFFAIFVLFFFLNLSK